MTSAAPTNWNRKSLLCCRKASLGWPTPKRAELHPRNQKGSALNLVRRSRTSSPPQRIEEDAAEAHKEYAEHFGSILKGCRLGPAPSPSPPIAAAGRSSGIGSHPPLHPRSSSQ